MAAATAERSAPARTTIDRISCTGYLEHPFRKCVADEQPRIRFLLLHIRGKMVPAASPVGFGTNFLTSQHTMLHHDYRKEPLLVLTPWIIRSHRCLLATMSSAKISQAQLPQELLRHPPGIVVRRNDLRCYSYKKTLGVMCMSPKLSSLAPEEPLVLASEMVENSTSPSTGPLRASFW